MSLIISTFIKLQVLIGIWGINIWWKFEYDVKTCKLEISMKYFNKRNVEKNRSLLRLILYKPWHCSKCCNPSNWELDKWGDPD